MKNLDYTNPHLMSKLTLHFKSTKRPHKQHTYIEKQPRLTLS